MSNYFQKTSEFLGHPNNGNLPPVLESLAHAKKLLWQYRNWNGALNGALGEIEKHVDAAIGTLVIDLLKK
jgi:hypothetical protein